MAVVASHFRTRIGKIRMKNGGAELRVLENPTLAECDHVRAYLASDIEDFAEQFPNLGGYILIGWNLKGRTRTCWQTHSRSPYSAGVLPTFAQQQLLKCDTLDLAEFLIDERLR